ncbi:Uncharacterized protein PECH_007838 [Penicillium ucsense]|uniref:Guanyl-nucleotide exchange factor n=1 Tax=Penicillium ucsense TaxID=2839758 RepID=A0A8J8VZI1_9EURO|nr:Uncharacterized protein PECM_007736 [Penicillium ucsense]KAF7734563.1 Uncharacterized protein PECH_007838 [Penicillium ucsense]
MEELPRSSRESQRKPARQQHPSIDSQIADSTLSTIHSPGAEEPGRLSTTSIRSAGRDLPFNESQRSSVSVPDPRFSESSRSDQSHGDQTFRTNSPRDVQPSAGATGKRFRMPRLKRHRSPLFPLPPKVPSPTNRALPADDARNHGSDHDQISPLPSPTRSSVGLAVAGAPPLLRNNSTNSARSIRSNPSLTGRGRSSTMGSLAEHVVDDLSAAPWLASSGRTSTSTSGRKSFGDIFNFSQRLRQNSEPPIPRHGSPGIGGTATPLKPELPPVPAREEGETPAAYLTKLEETLPRGMIGGILAQSDDEFYKVALRKYMRSFSYFGDPIDMAIRKLLMEVELPKETQQIDRFLQAFADRYHECNPGIFASTDQAYFIAFSILILHTDVFNKNNKRKMQKLDYVKNCRGEGISEDILECFYENIAYTPFIHVEDANIRDRHLAKPRRTLFRSTSSEHLPLVTREPVDPYTLILDNKLSTLRPSLKEVMDLEDTYSHIGSEGRPNMDDLHLAFAKSGILQIISQRSRPDAFMQASLDNPAVSHPGLVDIKVAKVGLLWRKDPKKKRARSPWAEWGAVLTFSQLYFFRNVTWVRNLMTQHEVYEKKGRRGTLVFRPPLAEFKPDGIMSTNDAVALLDSNYKKHKHAFSFVRHNSVEEVFLADSESDMNDWIHKLNYAAAFRTTGVRTKGMIATNYEGQRYRRSQRIGSISSSTSHQSRDQEPTSPSIDSDVVAEFVAGRRQLMSQKIHDTNEKLFANQRHLDELLRNARHLQILTPVTPRARESVIMAAARMAAKLRWVRQDLSRNKCYREILLRDLGEEETDSANRTGSVAGQTTSTHTSPPRLPSVSGPSIKSEPSLQITSDVDHGESSHDIAPESTATVPAEKPRIDMGFLSQPTTEDLRRPSIPTSVTSTDLGRIGRSVSVARASASRSESAPRLEREVSTMSRGSKFDAASLGSRASKITSPVSFDDGEERLLRDTGLLDHDSPSKTRKTSGPVPEKESEDRQDESSEVSHSDHRSSRVRRSLHRTLRESHSVHRHQSRHKKNSDSVSSVGPLEDEGSESNILARKTPSFTVHGKKASVVTFGSEWQNMSPEERLKLRKPTPHEEHRGSDPTIVGSGESITSEGLAADRRQSVMSASTMTGLSVRSDDEDDDDTIDQFKDAQEILPSSPLTRSKSQSTLQERVTDVTPDHSVSVEDKRTTTAPSGASSGLFVYGGNLNPTGEVDSPSSSSLGERGVNTPSSENLRPQEVGA